MSQKMKIKKDNENIEQAIRDGFSLIAFNVDEHLKWNTNLDVKTINTDGIEYEIELGFDKIAKEVREGFDRLIESQSK